ncbi:alpha/beta hydrolase [Acetobacter indonesiensis]|uniref:alpha/beta hydrolase n=1 Tax=Acetobacter indonesiensis TaxID=104101 RepID=UPI0020A25645|nr:alpha/beta hydrolase [Acetobacter indonesiensis]MCP1229716.1 alpha/beta hydrolase [Acetobacter indonesiensis]
MAEHFAPHHNETAPLIPNLPARILLGWIKWQAAHRARKVARSTRQQALEQESMPPIPAPEQVVDHAVAQASFLKTLRKVMDTPSFPTRLSAFGLRKVYALFLPDGAGGVMAARLYVPHGRVRGAVLYLHGGGFVHCGLNSHHGICCRLASASGAAVLLPDYRLAPEHPYPAAADDALAALRWLVEASHRHWGGAVAVAGDSAGGNLAAVLAQDAKAGAVQAPVLQLLYYPSLYGAEAFPSHDFYSEGYFLSRRSMQWYGEQYIAREEDWTAPRFVPGKCADLTGLAPALIITAECDPMRDEGAAYARALKAAGVAVRYICYRGALHGFLNFYSLMPPGKSALRAGARALRKAFAKTSSGKSV